MCEYQNYSHPYNNHYFYHHPTQISSPSSASAYYAADISYYQHRTPTSIQHLMVDPWRTPPLPPDSYQHHHHHHSYQHQHHHPYQQQHYTESYGIRIDNAYNPKAYN
ncbi:hypothetical protein O3M35_013360 [Rhynocoris fuscipes]|uniref:Uncharacterized protein n=1 Tax=Rhynocoris fuscipes TaxID=488301 RepID=A0AAW1CDX9_9HEMI